MGQGENKGLGRGCCTLRGVWGNFRTLGREGKGWRLCSPAGFWGGTGGVAPQRCPHWGRGWGGQGSQEDPPPHRCCLPSEDPPIPMEAAAKFLNHIGGCHPQTLPGMR